MEKRKGGRVQTTMGRKKNAQMGARKSGWRERKESRREKEKNETHSTE